MTDFVPPPKNSDILLATSKFHGHTHLISERQRGSTRIINPGALHRAKTKTFAILESGKIETVQMDELHLSNVASVDTIES